MRKERPLLNRLRAVAPLLLLIGVGLLLRLWFVSVNELQPTNSPADDGDYYQRALRFAATGQYIDDFWLIRPPLHVFLFALMLKISIVLGNVPGLALVRGAQIALSLFAIPIGYHLAARLFNRRAGLIFATLLAVWYPLVELPAHLFTEPLFIFLLLAHFWLLVWWRDERRWYLLAGSGVALGLTALTRSVAVYGIPFVVLWLVLEQAQQWWQARQQHQSAPSGGGGTLGTQASHPLRGGPDVRISRMPSRFNTSMPAANAPPPALRPMAATVGRWSLLFLLPCALVIVPWTIRNYVVYERFILVDTIGSVNLWLHMEKYEEKGVEVLKQMPQRDRHVFSSQDTMRMFKEDPVHFWKMLWRNAWLHFLHIWKGQFIEDFLLKVSFYGRPLREVWPLGVAGDALWFGFTLGGLVALVAPLREGMVRVVALCWVGYTMLTVMLFHLEPRYLMPLWLVLMLYSAWTLSSVVGMVRLLRERWRYGVAALGVALAFLVLVFTYRDYPATLAAGYARESHYASGTRAYAAGDYATAVNEFEAMVDAHPSFVSSHAYLALALAANGQYDAALRVTDNDNAQHMLLARGAIARGQGHPQEAAALLTRAEKKAGHNIQRMAWQWLPPAPTTYLELGNGQDYGSIKGFSLAEETLSAAERSYRWLQGRGQVRMPLPQPLARGSVLALRLAANTESGPTPLHLAIHDPQRGGAYRTTIQVVSGRWRTYRVLVPEALAGQQYLDLTLEAPIFIPAHYEPGSNDIRPISLMVGAVRVSTTER